MDKDPNYKPFEELEERCLRFALRTDQYIRKLPKDVSNIDHGRQLTRSAGSVGANYIEANESLGEKDCTMKMRTSKKEAKESRFWFKLTVPLTSELGEREILVQE